MFNYISFLTTDKELYLSSASVLRTIFCKENTPFSQSSITSCFLAVAGGSSPRIYSLQRTGRGHMMWQSHRMEEIYCCDAATWVITSTYLTQKARTLAYLLGVHMGNSEKYSLCSVSFVKTKSKNIKRLTDQI